MQKKKLGLLIFLRIIGCNFLFYVKPKAPCSSNEQGAFELFISGLLFYLVMQTFLVRE